MVALLPSIACPRESGDPGVPQERRTFDGIPAFGGMSEVFLRLQSPPNGGSDPILGGAIEIGVHGQADDFVGELFAYRKPALGDREAAIGRLPVQWLGIVDRGRNALRLQRGRE